MGKIEVDSSFDVIAGILGFIGSPNEATYLKGGRDPKAIHEAIFQLRKKYSLLKVFAFSQNDVYPFSRQLEKVLSMLLVARILKHSGADFRYFIVSEKAKQVIHKSSHVHFTASQLFELQEIAKEFGNLCLVVPE